MVMSQDEKEILLQKFADVTRRLNVANAQLEEANKKLKEYEEKTKNAEKASQMKSLFLANMSHEIRTPLNAIEGFARILVEADSLQDRMSYLEIIESNNRRLLSLVNEILDLSRVEAGEISIKKSNVDLNYMLEGIKQLFKFRCPETINLNWNKPTMSVMMTTDEDKLTQVFSNLISNALKHTIRGSITYGYKLINDHQDIEFFVSDTGSGIDPQFIDQIFNTYASKDAEQKKGYGLGLALCKIIVEKMGGQISVQSKVDAGSTFTFRMPFHGTIGGMATSNRTTTSSQMVRTLRVSNRSNENQMKTILVAEDEESNYELVRIVLQKRYNLIHAHNGIEAVTMNEEDHPDLILMDIRMPEMNGLDATRIIKEVNHETPVIALSAYAFEENIREAKAAGCDDFLAKPFRVEDLIETIVRYIGE
ncbi:MAG: response regulator [Prevotella sp.]|jgi:CheY-like chemotaxis protein/nitrogen-specific signal transduction histidine kinase